MLLGSGICKCGHNKGSHTKQVNDDGLCNACKCRRFVDARPDEVYDFRDISHEDGIRYPITVRVF